MIEVAHLTRRYGPLAAVDDLSFALGQGEVVGFLGPNGAGKTTTMRILAGYLPATHAEQIQVAGFDVLRQSMQVRQRIGYLPESVPLYRELRVEEMLHFHGRLHGMDKTQRKAKIPEVLERVGVADRHRQLVGNLSRGLKQRVGLAVALLPDPEVLILDEPTSGLDPIQRQEVRGLIRELAADHTVLLSSHILAEIEMICPRVIILDRGRLLADGTQEELVQRFGSGGTVDLEAVCGDAAEAQRLLLSLPDVEEVEVLDRTGIHQAFQIRGAGDLREDVGALAMQKGWALRQLSTERLSLEDVFGKLVLGQDLWQERGEEARGQKTAPAPAASAASAGTALGGGLISLMPDGGAPAQTSAPIAGGAPAGPGSPAGGSAIYSLNPFDRGADRDLSKPVSRDAAPNDPPSAESGSADSGSADSGSTDSRCPDAEPGTEPGKQGEDES